jgi:DNA-binding transcriptional LysR family regulator
MNAMRFDWSELETFLATARGGTLAAAGKALRVDAATVQRRMGKLEASAGAKLFHRSPRGYALTEAGQDLMVHAQAMEEHALSAWRKVLARDEQPIGVVRVATVDDVAVHVVPEIVASFRESHPNIMVSVDVRTSFHDLARNEADVAFRIMTRAPEGDLIARKLVKTDAAIYASRGYLKEHGRPKTPDDLRAHDIVCADPMYAMLPQEKVIARYADPARIAFRSRSFLAMFAAVQAGIGIGFAPIFYADRDRTVVRLFTFPETLGQGTLYLVSHVDTRTNARVRAYVEHAKAMIVAQRTRFEL